jgi:hypothetical protein
VAKYFLVHLREASAASKKLLSFLFTWTSSSERAQNAGDLSEGSYPFPFRTRQSSPLEPMVLRKGESRLSPAFWVCLHKRPRTYVRGLLSYTVSIMDWAHKRKFIVIAIFVALVVAVVAIIGFSVFYHTPTCTDKKMNQDEVGVDCGGSCSTLCSSQVASSTVRFARTLIQSGRTDVIAYVDNTNSTAFAKDAAMTLEAYKSDGTLVTAHVKVTLPPRASVPVFIPGIASAGAGIRQAFLTFDTGSPVWMRGSATDPTMRVDNIVTLTPETKPRITANLVNQTARPQYDTVVTVTIFDTDGTAMAASQTIVPILPAQGTAPMVFTWNEPFAAPVVRVDMVPTSAAPRIQL